MSTLTYALHGFLGTAQDWSGILPEPFITPNYFSDTDFEKLEISNFIKDIQKHSGRKIFVGYSLGGRIGLQILEHQPELFDHYVFISTHPGLQTEEEKAVRRQDDQQWIEKLKASSWTDFITAWNEQPVLANSGSMPLKAAQFVPKRLVQALSQWSLGNQRDYREALRQHQRKITWIVGQKDQKFLNLANELEQKKILLNIKKIFSGHRALLDNPKDVRAQLELAVDLKERLKLS